MTPSRLSRLVTISALCLFVQSSGCSFAFVETAPPEAEWPRYEASLEPRSPCTESFTAPFMDGAMAAGLTGLSAMVWLDSRHPAPNSEGDVPVGLLAVPILVAMVPFLISAIYGASEIGRCREYRRGPPYDQVP
jgi:hypothetical protein